jgi:hypothetical protein
MGQGKNSIMFLTQWMRCSFFALKIISIKKADEKDDLMIKKTYFHFNYQT